MKKLTSDEFEAIANEYVRNDAVNDKDVSFEKYTENGNYIELFERANALGLNDLIKKFVNELIQNLQEKNDVFVRHARVTQLFSEEIDGVPGANRDVERALPFGGTTWVYIVDRDTKTVIARTSAVCSETDRFNRAFGTAVALSRLYVSDVGETVFNAEKYEVSRHALITAVVNDSKARFLKNEIKKLKASRKDIDSYINLYEAEYLEVTGKDTVISNKQ